MYKFKSYVYEGAYVPFYDKYKGHTFVIDHYMEDDGHKDHVWMSCNSDPLIIVDGYVHLSDLEEA